MRLMSTSRKFHYVQIICVNHAPTKITRKYNLNKISFIISSNIEYLRLILKKRCEIPMQKNIKYQWSKENQVGGYRTIQNCKDISAHSSIHLMWYK